MTRDPKTARRTDGQRLAEYARSLGVTMTDADEVDLQKKIDAAIWRAVKKAHLEWLEQQGMDKAHRFKRSKP